MILNAYFMHLRADYDPTALTAALEEMGTLLSGVDGISDFVHGPNQGVTSNTPDYQYGFSLKAASNPALQAATGHDAFREVFLKVVMQCDGLQEGMQVFCLDTGGPMP